MNNLLLPRVSYRPALANYSACNIITELILCFFSVCNYKRVCKLALYYTHHGQGSCTPLSIILIFNATILNTSVNLCTCLCIQ